MIASYDFNDENHPPRKIFPNYFTTALETKWQSRDFSKHLNSNRSTPELWLSPVAVNGRDSRFGCSVNLQLLRVITPTRRKWSVRLFVRPEVKFREYSVSSKYFQVRNYQPSRSSYLPRREFTLQHIQTVQWAGSIMIARTPGEIALKF